MLDHNDPKMTPDPGKVIDLQALDRLVGAFVLATGLPAGCGVFDFSGERLVPVDLTRFPRICRVVWTSPQGQQRCKEVFRQVVSSAAQAGSMPFGHRTCHLGLKILSVPIFRETNAIGVVLCGQVWSKSISARRRASLVRSGKVFQIDEQEMGRAVDEVQVVPASQIEGAAGLLQAIVNYVVGTSLAKQRSEREVELETLLYETELGLLQSQINPHFLFNTLNAVMWLASLEQATETVKVVCALADLLRYNVKQVGHLVPLEQEAEQIRRYLLIQRARFGDRLHFVVDVDRSVASAQVPVLLLQPLVENAIIHGLEMKVGRGTLALTARRENGQLIIEVRDDGIGMSPEVVGKIVESTTKGGAQVGTIGLGLVNVVRSLRHHFGQDPALEVLSSAGVGTTVRLVVPIVEAVVRSSTPNAVQLPTHMPKRASTSGERIRSI